jgi:hypothetical protein
MHLSCTTRKNLERDRGAISIEARRYKGMPPSTDCSKHHAPDTSAAKARALLDASPDDDDVTDPEFKEIEK